MLLYLDQNYASRISKYRLGQKSHEHFGELDEALRSSPVLIPPSPFHVLELRGGYLLPSFQELFAEFSQGYWVRPWQEVVARQAERKRLEREDLLWRGGNWQDAAEFSVLEGLLECELKGPPVIRAASMRREILARLGFSDRPQHHALAFVRLLAKLVVRHSLDQDRYARPSDLTDLVMAATVGPYVDVLATDRYQREMLERAGYRKKVFSGRRHEVAALTRYVNSFLVR